MDKLLFSRKKKEEIQQKLGSISPEKYGKGAFSDLGYTPSKLADNVLFREASNLKKIEEESSKSRQFQVENHILSDQIEYLKKQRDGISGSLNEIITMYKKIIAEMQAKNEERLKEYQKKWSQQIQKFIKDKEEQARYFQSEREILETRIEELQAHIQTLNDQLQDSRNIHADFQRQVEGISNQKKNLEEKFAAAEKKAEQDSVRAKNQFDSLKKQYMHAEVSWKNTLNQEMRKKDKERQTIERSHRAELQKVQNSRKNESILKNQEINEITRTFEAQTNRLKQILGVKDKMIENLSVENNKEKNRILNLTRDYENQISHLTHEKNRLIDELQNLGHHNEILAKDKVLLAGDLQRQNANLRDLLMQSSMELQRCKDEFMSLAKENGLLLGKLKGAEEEAKTWRDSYYLNKTRPY